MKISDIDSNIKITDMENFFEVYEDQRGNYSYNLNETLYLNVGDSYKKTYTLKTDAFWPLISYKIYNTTRLAWLLMKLNDVQAKDMFTKKKAGEQIIYLDSNVVEKIIKQL